jgi:hypothetical protein
VAEVLTDCVLFYYKIRVYSSAFYYCYLLKEFLSFLCAGALTFESECVENFEADFC